MADPYFTPNRSELIDEILSDLRSGVYDNHQLAVNHLIDFFEAARNPFSYAIWLFFTAPFLKQDELLELTDLGNRRWNEIFYPLMIETERLPFPGLVAPLVAELSKKLSQGSIEHVLQLGSGPMEIERQVIANIKESGKPVHFVGIDLSEYAHRTARKNLEEVGIKIREVRNSEELRKLLEQKPTETSVTLYHGDGVGLIREINFTANHLLFHSLFRHHLTMAQKETLDTLIREKEIPTIEYDGFKNSISRVLASFGTWGNPIFLNSAVISNCRYDKKRATKYRSHDVAFYFPVGTYLSILQVS